MARFCTDGAEKMFREINGLEVEKLMEAGFRIGSVNAGVNMRVTWMVSIFTVCACFSSTFLTTCSYLGTPSSCCSPQSQSFD